MTDLEIALRAAVNVLRDSAESGKMPSGEPLAADAKALHTRAADQLDNLARALSPDADSKSTLHRALEQAGFAPH